MVKVRTLKEMKFIEKLKNRYSFTESGLVDKYAFYREKDAIVTHAFDLCIACGEKKFGLSPRYDHWTTSKL